RRLIRGGHRAHYMPGLERYLPVNHWEDAGTADLAVQLAADRQQRVADFLRGQTAGRKGSQQLVVRIDSPQLLHVGVVAALLVRLRGHDEPMQLLDGPVVLYE